MQSGLHPRAWKTKESMRLQDMPKQKDQRHRPGDQNKTHDHNPPGRCDISHGRGNEKTELIGFPCLNQFLPLLSQLLRDQETRHAFHHDEKRPRQCQRFPPQGGCSDQPRVYGRGEGVEAHQEEEWMHGDLKNRQGIGSP